MDPLGPTLGDVCRKVEAAKISPESIPGGGGAAGGGSKGGGGGGGAPGGAGNTQSLIDASKLNLAELQGSREGASLAADSAGGFSGYGGGAKGDDESSIPGMKTQSQGGNGTIAGGVASATDVEKRYGPSVITIVSDVIRNKCAQGRFLHCGPGK